MIRDVIGLSDTDSTCGSYDEWVEWYYNEPRYDNPAVALATAVSLFNIQLMDHNIKVFARNMNIPKDLVELLKMKNEYYWLHFTPANVSKHYFADVISCEGNIYTEGIPELKGVHFIASSIDRDVVKVRDMIMQAVTLSIRNNEQLDVYPLILATADVERKIINDIKSGNINIFKSEQIQGHTAYKLDKNRSPYSYHTRWIEIFGEKYGIPEEPPYMVIKVPTILDKKENINNWKAMFPNLADKITEYLSTSGKDTLSTFKIPMVIALDKGCPNELIEVIDKYRIIQDNCEVLYKTLETLGVYKKPNLIFSEMGY